MSTDFFTPAVDDEDPAMRAQKLAAARRKLKTFRAGRTSSSEKDHISCPSSASSRSRSSASVTSLPLTSDTAGNTNNQALFIAPPRSPVKGLETPPRSPQKLRKPRSKGNLRTHGRKGSSIGGSHQFGQDFFFGTHSNAAPQPSLPLRGVPGDLPAMTTPSEIITTPATPLMEHPASMDEQVKTRLSTFSFGSKPPPDRLPSPRRSGQPLLPSQILPFDPSPSTSPSKRLSTPHSRPPSLLLTKPTPLTVGTPSSSGPSRQMESPKTPPTPARTKRHSHTRSSSISLPNLKLASRPGSLGVSTSPSFPSPSSPVITRLSTPQGTKLKFEPSGRGAEAEREKDEYRRKALEKLTGTADYANEIALPELDDDVSSTTSSARPFSGVGSFTFGSGQRNSWTVPDDNEEAGLGFGLSLTPDEYSLPSFPSTGFNATHDTLSDAISAVKSPMAPELGHGLPSIVSMPNRPSMTRNLSVLAEVDEPEEGETESDIRDETLASMTGGSERSTSSVLPTPSRLRELHLVTTSGTPPVASPTTYSGARGRPRPLSGTFKVTPKSSTRVNRRSSISYKKDDSVSSNGSSRDWSLSSISKGLFSPGSPTFASPRMASRPCPRPKVLAGLSLADGGSRRVLDEVEEEGLQTGYSAFGFPTSPMMDDPRSSEEMSSRDSMFGFRGSNFELEMERDGLREEVDKWKDSYHDMEERWIAEKREVVLLRERLRKLGDRLSSFSSESTNLASDRMMADMRNELFGVTSQLDKERAEKLAAQDRILELEEQLARAQCQSVNQAPVSPPKPTSSYLSSPLGSLPNNGASPDPNLSRIKGWGFPRGPIMSSMSREPRTRDSFFGLSNDLRRGSGEPQPGTGVDLPPFSLTPESASHSPFGSAQDDTTTTRKETSTSLTGSAMSYFSAYLPQAQQSTTEPTPTHSQSHASSILDFTRACRCCTGEVIQL